MIKDQDRSGWIGASDTRFVMGNWSTKTWQNWWMVKLGLRTENYHSVEMMTGTAKEHQILEAIGVKDMDRQIKIRHLRLRVNLDGEIRDRIKEAKTHKSEVFKLSTAYWQQAQVEMYATGKKLDIVSYRLKPEDYDNWFLPIDTHRLKQHEVKFDKRWIEKDYLPRLEILAKCLKEKRFPNEKPN